MERLFDQHDFAPSKDKLVGPSTSAVFLYYNELIPLIPEKVLDKYWQVKFV